MFDREYDEANGWSSVYQKEGIHLFLYPPEEFSVLSHHRDYALNLFVHELTHSLQIGKVSGVPKWINYLFGNLLYPSQLSPGWLLEGVAVYSESHIDGTGRLHSPLWRAWFDSFFRKGNVLSLGEMSGSTDHWMGGHLPYLYGSFFYDFLMRRYDPGTLATFFDEMSDNVLPFLDEVEAHRAFGAYFWELYGEFLDERRARLFARTDTPQEPQETGLRYTTLMVDTARNDRYVYYGRRPGEQAVVSFDGKEATTLFRPPDPTHFAAHADGRFLFSLPFRSDQDRMRSELFLFDPPAGEIRRIAPGESSVYPFFLPDGGIACFTVTDGLNTLRLFDVDGTARRSYRLVAFDTVHTPSLDVAGERLIFTGNLRGEDKDIFLLDLDDGSVTRIVRPGDQYSASFTDDGRILFSSAEGERIVPLLLAPATGELFRLYDPPSLALYPKIIEERLFFVAFDNDGYFPAWVPFRPVRAGTVELDAFAKVAAAESPVAGHPPVLEPAHGFEGMWPTLLLPDYRFNMHYQKLGLTLFGAADTERRGYSLSVGKAFDASDRWETHLTYYDRDLMPDFRVQFSYYWLKGLYGDPEVRTYPGTLQEFSASLSTALHFDSLIYLGTGRVYRLGHSFSVSAGFRFRDEAVNNDLSDPTIFPYHARDGYYLQMGTAYSLYLNFSPGSYLLFSPMDASALRLPVTLERAVHSGVSLLTFSPSVTYSYLFGTAGKSGFVTRHSFYAAFLNDARYSIGGEEKDLDLLNLDNFIYGRSNNVTVRGYRHDALTGKTIYYANTEYRYHILAIEQALGLLPVMLKNLQGALFIDMGAALEKPDPEGERFIASAGAEVKLLTYWWYRVPLMFTLGVAHGFTDNGVLNVYFSLGNSF